MTDHHSNRALERLHQAFHHPGTAVHRAVEVTVWLLIFLSVGLFAAELLLPQAHAGWLAWTDRVILSIFALELLLRVLTFRVPLLQVYADTMPWRLRRHILGRLRFLFQPLQLIDLLTVLAVVPTLRMLRAVRLLRLLRTRRVFRYARPVHHLARAFSDNALLFHLALTLMVLAVVVGGLTIYFAENGINDKITSTGEGIWWAVVTITTVGYGDITPVTTAGRIVGGAMMVMGMFTLALFAGIVGSTLLGAVLKLRQEQFRMSDRANHIVICGYDASSQLLHDELLAEFGHGDTELAVFADGERPAGLPPDFTWISGDPTKESELDKARMAAASAVLIVGSRATTPQLADARTILIVFTIRSYTDKHPGARERRRPLYVIAEVLDAENVIHARTAGADEVIQTKRLGFALMAHSAAVRGAGEIMTSVALSGAHNLYIGENPFEQPLPYGELSRRIKERYGVTVLGLRAPAGEVTLGPDDGVDVERAHGVIYLGRAPVLKTFEAA